jgi:hypothetical protein
VVAHAGCVSFAPAGLTLPGVTPNIAVTVPRNGVEIRVEKAQSTVRVRRFGQVFIPVGVLAPNSSARLRATGDAAQQPWHLRVQGNGAVDICASRAESR